MKLDHEKVRWHRDRLGLTLDSLSERAEVAKGTVLRAEHGEDVRPSSGRRIARALGVNISDLIPEKPGSVGELVGAGKGKAPSPGPSSVVDLVLDAARRQAVLNQQAFTRAKTSGQADEDMRPLNEAFRNLLERNYGDVAEALTDLARDHVELEQEAAQLREQIAALQEERQRAYQEQ